MRQKYENQQSMAEIDSLLEVVGIQGTQFQIIPFMTFQ